MTNPWALILACVAIVNVAQCEDWPQWRGTDRNGEWNETGIISKFGSERLEPVWDVPLGPGYSGPVVADGRVFITDRPLGGPQQERVVCLDEKTGETRWQHAYDCVYRNISYTAGPRASVTVSGERAYSLGAMGHLFCFKVEDGTILWSKDLNEQYKIDMPNWGIATSPIVEGDQLIVAIGGQPKASVVSFDAKTGEERWTSMSDRASYAAPIVIDQAGRRVLVVWTEVAVNGLAPESGEILWREDHPPVRFPSNIATPVLYENKLFVSAFYDGSLLLELGQERPTIQRLWHHRGPDERRSEALHSMITTPIIRDGVIYGLDAYGQLRGLDLATGERLWESLDAVPQARWATVHMVRHMPTENIWMFNEKGELLIAQLSREGYREIDRTKIIDPTLEQLRQRGGVCWSHPAFANRHVIARSDEKIVRISLAE
jgi:outer membrane protein assembly factor BamB